MTELSNKIIDKIKTKEIKPKPRWQFKFRELSKLAALGILVVFLGLITALLWYFLADIDLGLGILFHCPLLIGHGPGLIIVFLILISAFSILLVKKIKGSYRYNLIIMACILLIFALFLSLIFHHLNYGQRLDHSFSRMPFYQSQSQFMTAAWQQPDQGRIAGEIIEVKGSTNFILKDIDGQEWSVSSLDTAWRHGMVPEIKLRIKMKGRQLKNFDFEASDIRPWTPGSGRCGMASENQEFGGCRAVR